MIVRAAIFFNWVRNISLYHLLQSDFGGHSLIYINILPMITTSLYVRLICYNENRLHRIVYKYLLSLDVVKVMASQQNHGMYTHPKQLGL